MWYRSVLRSFGELDGHLIGAIVFVFLTLTYFMLGEYRHGFVWVMD